MKPWTPEARARAMSLIPRCQRHPASYPVRRTSFRTAACGLIAASRYESTVVLYDEQSKQLSLRNVKVNECPECHRPFQGGSSLARRDLKRLRYLDEPGLLPHASAQPARTPTSSRPSSPLRRLAARSVEDEEPTLQVTSHWGRALWPVSHGPVERHLFQLVQPELLHLNLLSSGGAGIGLRREGGCAR